VLNKLDLVPEGERNARIKAFVKAYRWTGTIFGIAAINGEGCRQLTDAVQNWLDAHPAEATAAPPENEEPIVLTPKPIGERVTRRRRSSP